MNLNRFFKCKRFGKFKNLEIGFHNISTSRLCFEIGLEFSGWHNGFYFLFVYWKNKCFEFNVYDIRHNKNESEDNEMNEVAKMEEECEEVLELMREILEDEDISNDIKTQCVKE